MVIFVSRIDLEFRFGTFLGDDAEGLGHPFADGFALAVGTGEEPPVFAAEAFLIQPRFENSGPVVFRIQADGQDRKVGIFAEFLLELGQFIRHAGTPLRTGGVEIGNHDDFAFQLLQMPFLAVLIEPDWQGIGFHPALHGKALFPFLPLDAEEPIVGNHHAKGDDDHEEHDRDALG